MAHKQSAGILLYRRRQDGLEVFLVHPGGPYWARKDEGAWSLPKGEIEEGEDPLAVARREFREETGSDAAGPFVPLEPLKQAGGKVVQAWAAEGDLDPAGLRSNTFNMEWPPRSGVVREYPEVDRGAWFSISVARAKLVSGQRGFLEQLLATLWGRGQDD